MKKFFKITSIIVFFLMGLGGLIKMIMALYEQNEISFLTGLVMVFAARYFCDKELEE
jgi:hypothetical protein